MSLPPTPRYLALLFALKSTDLPLRSMSPGPSSFFLEPYTPLLPFWFQYLDVLESSLLSAREKQWENKKNVPRARSDRDFPALHNMNSPCEHRK